jgi:hypothetical protein
LFASNSGNNLRLVEKLEHLQSPKTSVQYSSGTLPKPCWVIFDEAATPRCSEKVADFLKAVFVQVDGRQNDQKASLKICKAWVAAMLNAEVARQAKECTDPKFLPFEEVSLPAVTALAIASGAATFDTARLAADIEVSGDVTSGTLILDRRRFQHRQANVEVVTSVDSVAVVDYFCRGVRRIAIR